MCGIALVFGCNGSSAEVMRRLLAALDHRGPDAQGTVGFNLRKDPDWSVLLGHTRLSIVGIGEIGNQPKWRHGQSGMIFNGEIYGPRPGQSLREAGIVSDTQWLWHRYKEEPGNGPEAGINGIWGVVGFDAREEIVTISRDPLGVIPVFAWKWQDGLIVSPEIQAIAKAVGPLPVDLSELVKAVASRQLAYGRYIDGLSCIGPGETRRYKVYNGKVRCIDSIHKAYLEGYLEPSKTFGEAFERAVFQQFQADVPLGIQLSGGADSSLIAATLVGQGQTELNAFVARTNERGEEDEADLAVENARRLGLRPPVEVKVDKQSFSDELISSLGKVDPAFSHPNFFAVKKIAAAAHEMGIKVLLCGEGADELFRGYSRLLPSNAMKLVSTKASYTLLRQIDFRRLNFDQCLAGTARREMESAVALHYQWLQDPSLRHLFSNYLHELLYRQNIAGMSHSVEVRPPFLDLGVVGFVLSHPRAFFSFNRVGLHLLKGAVRSQLLRTFPHYVGPRRKIGFAIPLPRLLNEDAIALLIKAVRFSANELAIDRVPWLERFLKGSLTTLEFERYLWPALVSVGTLSAAGHTWS